MAQTPPIQIVGAGLAGSLMALYLARRGRRVHLWERRADLRRADISAGRSINLALSTRGITALERVDLADAVLADAIPMPGRIMHAVDGALTFQAYGQAGQAINSVSRRALNATLLDAAEATGSVTLHFEARLLDVDPDTGALKVQHADGTTRRHDSALTIGADGAFSAVRARLQRLPRFDYEQRYIDHGYIELTIPPTPAGDFRLDPNGLHIWPRHDFMLIALPNADKTFTATLFLTLDRFAELTDADAVRTFFSAEFPDSLPLLPDLIDDFFAVPPSSLVTVRCAPYHHGDRVVLIGDAAHAVVPFYGQGMNAAFESARILDELLAAHPDDQATALATFSRTRKPDADAIRQLALDHHYEMRAATADDDFLAKKQIEQLLERELPDFKTLYGMVSFSNTPYAEAVSKAAAQDAWLRGLFSSH